MVFTRDIVSTRCTHSDLSHGSIQMLNGVNGDIVKSIGVSRIGLDEDIAINSLEETSTIEGLRNDVRYCRRIVCLSTPIS